MGYYWKSSIAASYTSEEINEMLDKLGFKNWSVEGEFMDLIIYTK